MCVQLDLFSGQSMVEPFEALSQSEFDDMCHRAGIENEVKDYNPCAKCRYFGMCDSDECAMKGFMLDSRKPLKDTYNEWNS